MGTDELRQLLGETLLAAGIAQQALSRAKQITDSPEQWSFIETAAEQVTAIAQAALLACARAKDTRAQITIEDASGQIRTAPADGPIPQGGWVSIEGPGRAGASVLRSATLARA
jgi:hypothetical protein